MKDDPSSRPLEGEDPRDAPGFHELLARYVEEVNAAGFVDPETILRDHPDLGPAILEDLETYVQLRREYEGQGLLGTLGDFTLRRQIGRGGMGVVYEAWENSMDRRVALKVLPAAVAADTRTVTRFVREAQLAGKLNHPNVVSVYGMGLKEQTPYYAMEFVEGETLAQILARLRAAEGKDEEKRMVLQGLSRSLGMGSPEASAEEGQAEGAVSTGKGTLFGSDDLDLRHYASLAHAFAGVAEGLQHAHAKGIIHRDIKPSNLILDRDGRLRILDFGLARFEGQASITASGDFLGTPLYMSPEQAMARRIPLDHRTDVYSLGATMYETLALRPPFVGKTNQDTLSQILFRNPEPPRRRSPRIPRDLETIVLKCLRKNPMDRYGTAEALAQDLRRFVRGDPIEARPETRWKRLLRRARRSRIRIAVSVVLLALGAIAAWSAYRSAIAERERRLAAYDPAVFEAVVKLSSGMFSLAEPATQAALTAFPLSFSFSLEPGELRQLLEESGRLEAVREAVGPLEALAREFPEKRDAHFHLARAYQILERSDLARAELEQTLDVDPGFAPARVLIGELDGKTVGPPVTGQAPRDPSPPSGRSGEWGEMWVAARDAARRKDWPAVVSAYDDLIAATERGMEPYIGFRLEAYLTRGAARIPLGRWEQAAGDFSVARFLAPDSLEPALLLGKAYSLAGREDLARDTFERLRQLRGDRGGETSLWIALVHASLGDHMKALGWADGLPSAEMRARLRAHLLLRLGEWGRAVEATREVLRLEPRSLQAHILLGNALVPHALQAGDDGGSEVLELLGVARAALELGPESESARRLARAAREVGREYLRTLGRRDAMQIHGKTILTAVSAVTAALASLGALGLASECEISDDFRADANLFDCKPMCWSRLDEFPTTVTPVPGKGIDFLNSANVNAMVFSQKVFSGEVTARTRFSFNGPRTPENPPLPPYRGAIFFTMVNFSMAGNWQWGSIHFEGKIGLSEWTAWDYSKKRGINGHVGFIPMNEEELELEVHATGDRVEMRVWRPLIEERPAVAQLVLESPTYKVGSVGFSYYDNIDRKPARVFSFEATSCLPAGTSFVRGDSNADGQVDISDAIKILATLFLGSASPGCLDAFDADDDGELVTTDAIYLLGHLFLGGPAPPSPYRDCGIDPTDDGLDCATFAGCD